MILIKEGTQEAAHSHTSGSRLHWVPWLTSGPHLHVYYKLLGYGLKIVPFKVKFTCYAGRTRDAALIPGSGRALGAGNGNLLSSITVHRAAKSQT